MPLTDRGRDLLESNRDREHSHHQEFYAGLKRERELEHDAQVFGAYLREPERLGQRDIDIDRVVLDYELNAFFAKLIRRGYAVASDCVHNRAQLFHVHHKPLYHAIGEPESRYRRPVPARRAAGR